MTGGFAAFPDPAFAAEPTSGPPPTPGATPAARGAASGRPDSPLLAVKPCFSRFLGSLGDRLHFSAHSHHLWPDVSFDAHREVWEDAERLVDRKWDRILGEVLPAAQGHVARILGLSDLSTVCFAPNTHELLVRILSCIGKSPAERSPVRVLTTDGEFHSFRRQSLRWEEAGRIVLDRVPVEPFATFPHRMEQAIARGGYDLLFFSHVFFNSGFVVPDLARLVRAVPSEDAFVVIDGYHSFFALPVDLGAVEDRAFYLSGGYKYAMSGEGACFVHSPPGFGLRPENTGWFAGFDDLEESEGRGVSYRDDGLRFFGATFDPSGLYRFRAVMDLWERRGVGVADIHAHVAELQRRFLAGLAGLAIAALDPGMLRPEQAVSERGHFLTFRTESAGAIREALFDRGVFTDHRSDRLRFGFGIYHDEGDVDALLARLPSALEGSR